MTAELVGRDGHRAALGRLIDRAREGHGGSLVLVGPEGVGKTALVDDACVAARAAGLVVRRIAMIPGAGAGSALTPLLDAEGGLVVVEDAVEGGPEVRTALADLATRAPGSSTAVLVTSTEGLGTGSELPVDPLTRAQHDALFVGCEPDMRDALWLGSLGRPALAVRLHATLGDGVPARDPVIALAERITSNAEFLDVDVRFVRLLEAALARSPDDRTRAVLTARLASELLGDAGQVERRRALAEEARFLARTTNDDAVTAEVLDLRLHALWDTTTASERLTTASEIVDLSRRAGDAAREHRGEFWRFVALMQLARVAEAEVSLAACERGALDVGDAQAAAVVLARHALLAAMRGRFVESSRLTGEFAVAAARAGLPDAEQVQAALLASNAVEQGHPERLEGGVEQLLALARRHPGQGYDATAASALALVGRRPEAAAELARCLPRALDSPGPRWLRSMAELAITACAADDEVAARQLRDALAPHRGELVIGGGAAVVLGPVSFYLGLLALQLGAVDEAVELLEEAAVLETTIGALPSLANTLALLAVAEQRRGDDAAALGHRARTEELREALGLGRLLDHVVDRDDEWSLQRLGDGWLLVAAAERAELRDSRGLAALRLLLASPHRDIPAQQLASGGAGQVVHAVEPMIDDAAVASYRARLAALDAELDAADRAGDSQQAERATAERDALVAELGRTVGLGGRRRAMPAEAERARVNVTRTLRATIAQIAAVAPTAGHHLEESIHTGGSCRYEPATGGPRRWRV